MSVNHLGHTVGFPVPRLDTTAGSARRPGKLISATPTG